MIENNKLSFHKFCVSIGSMPTTYMESLSYYETLVWLCKYLEETVIPAVDTNAEAVTELQALFTELQNYVSNYFNNLDVQEEINIKLDLMASNGTLYNIMRPYFETIDAKMDEQDERIANIENRVNSINNINPLIANSISEMTDTSRIYVNLSDGYWYSYDGTNWQRGGLYQSDGIANNSVTKGKINFKTSGRNKFNKYDYGFIEGYFRRDITTITSMTGGGIVYIPCEPNKSYNIYNSYTSNYYCIGTTETEPTIGTQVNQISNKENQNISGITTDNNANYLVLWVKHYSQNITIDNIVENLIITEDTFVSLEDECYNLNIKENDIKDELITPEKTTFYKTSRNELNYKDVRVMNLEFNTSTWVLYQGSGQGRTIVFPCLPNQTYTILRKAIKGQRFISYQVDEYPTYNTPIHNRITGNSNTKITTTTTENAKYICLLFYATQLDSNNYTEEELIKEIMITKGYYNGEFIPHFILDVKEENLPENSNNYNRFNTRNKVFGVEFNLASNSTKGTRIADSVGLNNDYVVNNIFQNGGYNDFDNIFPWCDIRLCNLKLQNGKKVITYENEDGFALDGSNGNVMVEIPKFYTMREIVGNKETLAITGEPKSGFEVEPAFLKNGKEVDFIYIGAYFAQQNILNGDVLSYSGSNSMSTGKLYDNITKFNNIGYSSYDFSIQLLLEILFTIEFADRDTKPYLQGVTYLPYYYNGTTQFLIQEVIDGNNFVVNNRNRMDKLIVGTQIGIGRYENNRNVVRTITNIVDDSENNTRTITVDGNPVNATALVDSLYGVGQNNGKCDTLNYHTGRISINNDVSPFRYRYMENIWRKFVA